MAVVDILSDTQAQVKAETITATQRDMVVKEQLETVPETIAQVTADTCLRTGSCAF